MHHDNHENREITHYKMNGNYQLKKKIDCSEKEKGTNMWEYWKRTHSKKLKKSFSGEPEGYLKQKLYCRNLVKRIKIWDILHIRYFILKVDERRTSTNGTTEQEN